MSFGKWFEYSKWDIFSEHVILYYWVCFPSIWYNWAWWLFLEVFGARALCAVLKIHLTRFPLSDENAHFGLISYEHLVRAQYILLRARTCFGIILPTWAIWVLRKAAHAVFWLRVRMVNDKDSVSEITNSKALLWMIGGDYDNLLNKSFTW